MDDVRIFIDNFELLLPKEKTNMAVSYSIDDASQLDASRDYITKTITVPVCKQNSLAFGFSESLDIVDITTLKLYNQNDHVGRIEQGGCTVLIGAVKLDDITGTLGRQYFNLTIIGNGRTWSQYMKQYTVRELVEQTGFYSGHRFYFTRTTAENTWPGLLPYLVGVINNRVRIRRTGAVVTTPGETTMRDFPITLFVHYLMRECFKAAGYTIASDFINSDYFRRKVMTTDKPAKSQEYIDARTFKVGFNSNMSLDGALYATQPLPLYQMPGYAYPTSYQLAFDNESDVFWSGDKAEFFDGNDLIQQGGWYRGNPGCAVSFGINIRMRKFVDYITMWPYNIELILVADKNYTNSVNYTGVKYVLQRKFYTYPADTFENLGQPVDFSHEFGSFIPDPDLRYGVLLNFPMTTPNPSLFQQSVFQLALHSELHNNEFRVIAAETSFYNRIATYPEENELINFIDAVPDLNALDFIRGIKHLFNLRFMTDINSKQVYIEPRDSFYRRDVTVDLTRELDILKDVKITDLGRDVNREIIFRYKADDNDPYHKEYTDNTGQTLAEHTAINESKFAEGETVYENPVFAATFMDFCREIGFDTIKIPNIVMRAGNEAAVYEPRILHYSGVKQINPPSYWLFKLVVNPDGSDNGDIKTMQEFPYLNAYDETTINDTSLYFNSRKNNPGLFENHYKNAVKTINESKRIEAYFTIDSNFIEGFVNIFDTLKQDFRARYFLRFDGDHTYARLEQISDYDPETSASTKMILTRDVDEI